MAKKTKQADAPDAFARFRAAFNSDIALWQWCFDKQDYEAAASVLRPVVEVMQKYKQVELLGRYAYNLAITYQRLGLELPTLRTLRLAYAADAAVHGEKAAKSMPAYTLGSQLLGWNKAWYEKAKDVFLG